MRNLLLGGLLYLGALPPLGEVRAASRVTTVRSGEDCQALVRRVYGGTPGAMARFHSANPQLGGLPHLLQPGDSVSIPPLARRGADRPARTQEPPSPAAEPARLSAVGPGVRTQNPGEGWSEALPDQLVLRRTRVQASQTGGAEVKLAAGVSLLVSPGGEIVVESLPKGQKPAVIEHVAGSLAVQVPRGGALVLRGPAGQLRLHGASRVSADGTTLRASIYEGGAEARTRGAEVQVPAGTGALLQVGTVPQLAGALLSAPAWLGAEGPILVPTVALLGSPAQEGRLEVPFSPLPGAVRYLVEVAHDNRFVDGKQGAEQAGAVASASLPPGTYHLRVRAVSADGLVGPPGSTRRVEVVALHTDAAPSLERAEAAHVVLPATGKPLLLTLDSGAPRDCAGGCAFELPPGSHRLGLSVGDARAEVQLRVTAAPLSSPYAVDPIEPPVPLWTPGFPARTLHPRSRAYLLFSLGSSSPGRSVDSYRFDLGGEAAFLDRRFSVDINLPVLHYDSGTSAGLVAGDLSFGLRAVALRAMRGRLSLGPLLRLQLPTGTFDRLSEPGSRPVVLDPAIGASAIVGPVGLLTTQGPTAVLNLPSARLRWSMSYAAEVRVWRVSVSAVLDAAIGMTDGSTSGVALGGGARLQPTAKGHLRLLAFVRGGLGDSGEELFGRYQLGLGAEWVR